MISDFDFVRWTMTEAFFYIISIIYHFILDYWYTIRTMLKTIKQLSLKLDFSTMWTQKTSLKKGIVCQHVQHIFLSNHYLLNPRY